MGYYSTMEGPPEFKTHCSSQEEIERIFKETFRSSPYPNFTIDDLGYDFVLNQEQEGWIIQLETDSCTQKHRHEQDLALFISKLIAPDDRTYLLFTGEDNEKWGYAIASGKVYNIEIVYLVEGIPLETWLTSPN